MEGAFSLFVHFFGNREILARSVSSYIQKGGKRMIRKIFSVLFGLLILAVAARAETGEEIALAAYPGYVVASSDSGNGFGVFALENGNETALCIVEDGRLTIANERAFKAGKNVKVYVDTDGESLFVRSNTEYEYVTLHAEYRAEGWTRCDVLNQESYGNGRTLETMLFERNDMLTMTVEYRDENDNPIGESETVRIPVGENFDLSRHAQIAAYAGNVRPGRKQPAGWICRAAFGRRRNADADGRLSGKADPAGSESGWQPMRARVRLGGRCRVQRTGQRTPQRLGRAGHHSCGCRQNFCR